MILELLTILAILSGGLFLMLTAGLRGWGLPALGFAAGTALMLILGSLRIIAGQPAGPVSTLVLTALIPAGVWAWSHRQGRALPVRIVPAVLLTAGTAAAVAGLHALNLMNLSPDSYRYAQIGSLLESGRFGMAPPDLLLYRLLAVPLLHAPANLVQAFFLPSLTPLLALTTVASLAWFCQKGAPAGSDHSWPPWCLPLLAALLLATNQFFIYNAFYINGHLLYALLLLLLVGSAWLRARQAAVPASVLNLLIFLVLPTLVITRPEGGLQAGIILLPLLVSDKFSRRQKILLLGLLGLSLITWNGFLGFRFAAAGQAAPLPVKGMFALGLACLLTIPLTFSRLLTDRARHLPSAAEISLWVALLIAAFLKPDLFSRSVHAILENLVMGEGFWGYSLIVPGLLFLALLIFSKTPDRLFLRFPVTTYIPLGLLLAFLRAQPYRVSPLDSFNRMFLHIVPLAILFLVSAAAYLGRKPDAQGSLALRAKEKHERIMARDR